MTRKQYREACKEQILRLSGLPFYPIEVVAVRELVDTLDAHSVSVEHMKAVVDECTEGYVERCPTPGDLRRLCHEKRPAKPASHEDCPNCDGSGFIVKQVGQLTGAAPCPGRPAA